MMLPIRRLPNHDPALPLPSYETTGSAGMDLRASLTPDDRARGVIIPAGGRFLVPTGLAMAIPAGFEGQVRPRSGLAVRHGITVLNSPGTIDSDYRGEICVPLISHGSENFLLNHGDRIAQLVIAAYVSPRLAAVDTLDDTDRGTGGFGSTGKT